MTLMLASVVNSAEAELVLRGGADVVDFADASAGTLGALPIGAIASGVAAIAGRRPVSAALGFPPYHPGALAERTRALAKAGVHRMRLAVDAVALDRLEPILRPLAQEIDLAGVLYADWRPDFDLIPRVAAIGFRGAFLDLAEASGRRLLDALGPPQIAAFRALCRRHGLLSCLAGSLQAPDIPRLLLVEPDVLGFRSALCFRGRRSGDLDPHRVALIRDLIPRETPEARGASNEKAGAPGVGLPEQTRDVIFVRDFVTEANIGAYTHERGATQRLLFNVEATVSRTGAHADDMRAIVSYDVILDAIRLVTGRGHIDFIETIAEEVAALVLKHPRVGNVRVRVEKLDVVAGSVGVEIRRDAR